MHVVTVHDPFHPLRGREVREYRNRRRICKLAPKTDKPFIIMVDGQPVLRKDWEQSVGGDQVVVVMMLPQGGGSNPLRIVGMLAVITASFLLTPFIAPAIGSFLGIGAAAAAAIGSSAILFGGSMLVNAIAPPPSARNSSLSNAANIPSASPTYNLQAQGNAARLGQAIPVQYGRMRVYPDFAAQPYVEYANNEQYLYQLMCIGQGEYNIEAVQINESPISSFSDVTYEVIPPGSKTTMFPANVTQSSEVSGQELLNTGVIGPFIANNTSTVCQYIGIDIVASRGMYYANDSGGLDTRSAVVKIEAQEVNQLGVAIGSWVTLGTETISGATTTPIRKSFKYAAPSSSQTYPRFQVRCSRTDAKDTETRAGNEVDWAGLRVYMPDTNDYGQVTLLAVRAQATNNLSSMSARQINVIATRKIKTVTATGLSASTSATRSLAAALADMATNTVYGGGMSTANIDWAQLYALDQTLTARGDYLDVRFDSASTLWEALTQAGIVARTKPFLQGGVLHFCRDAAATVPVALFSMRNIVQNSLSINYLTPTSQTADSVQVTYFDNTVWQQTTVTSDPLGVNPAKVSMLGITSRDQAFREGLYQAAANKYRRKIIKFSTEAEGFIPAFGDLIAIQHDIPAWGQVGEVTAWNSATKTLTVNEQLVWSAGTTHYVGLRKRDGTIDGPYAVIQGSAPNILVFSDLPAITPYIGYDEERTHIAFGPGNAWRQPARVVAVQPRGLYQVEITAVNEDPSVHTADQGSTAPAMKYSQLPATPPLPVIKNLAMVVDVTGAAPQYVATWDAAPGADHYVVEISWDSGTTWSALATEYATTHRWSANRNATATVRVAGVNVGRGAWSTTSVNYSAAPSAPTGFAASVTGDLLAFTWSANPEMDVVGYELRFADTGWGTSGSIFSGTSLTASTLPPAAGVATTYYLRAIDFLGNYSATSATVTFTTSAPGIVQTLTATASGNQVLVSWAKPSTLTSLQNSVIQFEVRTSDTGWGSSSGYVFKGDALSFLTAPPAAGASVTYYARAIDFRGNYSASSANVTFTATAVPNIASVAFSFYDTSATSATITLSWSTVSPQFGKGGYQVTYGSTTVNATGNSITLPANWIGDRVFTIKTIDQLGNLSSGYSQTITKLLPASPTNFRAQVIDNTVMLYWGQPSVTTLPISHYLLRRGAAWASADVDYGRKDGLFTTVVETAGGTYTYWAATVDTDGNVSTPVSITSVVAQPPDFVLYGQFASTFTGTKSSAFLEAGAVVMPVNTTQDWATHFTAQSWTSPQDQINAGYPVFIQPSSSPGYYEETFDFGTVLSSSRVSAAYATTTVAGSPVVSPTVSTSANGTTWTDYTGQTQVFAINFRYVKVRVTVTDSAGTGIVTLNSLSVTLDAKLKTDAGATACVSTDTTGTISNFSTTFVDVSSITVTPLATTPVTAVYDFLDSVITGTYSITSNVCTVSATGHSLVAGQNVRLSFTSGTAPSGVYTVASVINANSYTVALTTANTSGNVSTYPQGMRIYLFNSAGTRVNGTASWSVRGT